MIEQKLKIMQNLYIKSYQVYLRSRKMKTNTKSMNLQSVDPQNKMGTFFWFPKCPYAISFDAHPHFRPIFAWDLWHHFWLRTSLSKLAIRSRHLWGYLQCQYPQRYPNHFWHHIVSCSVHHFEVYHTKNHVEVFCYTANPTSIRW